jgi:hypothetical protein
MNKNNNILLMEPAFYYGIKHINAENNALELFQATNYFEYSLKKNPKDLSRHLQRVQFFLKTKYSHELYAALCDLFIVLGGLGIALRTRLLQLSKSKLSKQQIKVLVAHINDDSLGAELYTLPNHCYFKKKKLDKLKLYESSESEILKIEDVMATADSYIENSQFNTALDYMEKHLISDQENEELTIKLISLYKALNYRDEFNQAYKVFSNTLVTSRHWDEAKHYFSDM